MLAIVSGILPELSHMRRSSILVATEDIYLKLCTATPRSMRNKISFRLSYLSSNMAVVRTINVDSSIKSVDS